MKCFFIYANIQFENKKYFCDRMKQVPFKYHIMKKVATICLIIIFLQNTIQAQTDSIEVDEITISAGRTAQLIKETSRNIQIISRLEISQMPVQSINELLESILSVDIRQRGNQGVQADISIRGGSFEQTLILLNGMKINDPQTGHHNLNLPVDISQIERIEILEGPGSRLFGPNAFSGAINIITTESSDSKLDAYVSYGQYNLWNAGAKVVNKAGMFVNSLSINHKSSDGYIQNTDFNTNNIFFQSNGKFPVADITLQGGYTTKAFGAQSFYTPKYPSQFEMVKTGFIGFSATHGQKTKLSFKTYARRNQDRFELFRNLAPAWYKNHNYHLTDVFSAELNATHQYSAFKTSLGAEYRNEDILSNVLGTPLSDKIEVPGEDSAYFTKSDTRQIISFFGEQMYTGNRLSISAGLLLTWYSDYNWRIFAGADASYKLIKNLNWYASVNQSMRIPTYTDLYYVGPTNMGNINLKPEEAISYENGIKWQLKTLQVQTGIFYRQASNLIDWVRITDTEKWQSMNLTELNTLGIEVSGKFFVEKLAPKQPLKSLHFNYSYITSEKNSGNYISYYALDYLKNKLSVTAYFQFYKYYNLSAVYNYQQRNGTYTAFDYVTQAYIGEKSYSPFSTIDLRVSYQKKYFTTFVNVNNLANVKPIDFGNIELPGIWIEGGLKLSLDFSDLSQNQSN